MSSKEIKYKDIISSNIFFVKQMDYLGLQRRYLGYYLLIDIMQILINDDKRIESFSREIYPIVAKKYAKTTCTVERNIRSIIKNSWSYDMMTKLNTYKPEGVIPTCCEFIYLIKNFILNQII